jgi:hypothetical protein
MGDWCGPASDLSAGHRQAPNEKKTGARYRKITDCARRNKGEKKKILFTGNVCAYLTGLLMGEPKPAVDFPLHRRGVPGRESSKAEYRQK